jgi:hypothetical protein
MAQINPTEPSVQSVQSVPPTIPPAGSFERHLSRIEQIEMERRYKAIQKAAASRLRLPRVCTQIDADGRSWIWHAAFKGDLLMFAVPFHTAGIFTACYPFLDVPDNFGVTPRQAALKGENPRAILDFIGTLDEMSTVLQSRRPWNSDDDKNREQAIEQLRQHGQRQIVAHEQFHEIFYGICRGCGDTDSVPTPGSKP